MKITALKTFRPMNHKGETVAAGEVIDVPDNYGNELIRTGMAVSGTKAITELQNKMVEGFENKGLPTQPETIEERSQGYTGPQSVEEQFGSGKKGRATRTIKDPYNKAEIGEDPVRQRTPDHTVDKVADAGSIVSDREKSGLGTVQDSPQVAAELTGDQKVK